MEFNECISISIRYVESNLGKEFGFEDLVLSPVYWTRRPAGSVWWPCRPLWAGWVLPGTFGGFIDGLGWTCLQTVRSEGASASIRDVIGTGRTSHVALLVNSE